VKAEFFEQSSRAHFRAMASVSQKMHTHLIRGELKEFGLCMDEAWQLKRKMSSNVTNDIIDGLYKAAIEAGASGGKLLGAGSGGFFVFFVQPRFREAVSLKLTELGCTLRSVRFDCDGVTSWRTKAA
jgi:D-glycero-alpha-D-manno-heptose-7-phosphate kinase